MLHFTWWQFWLLAEALAIMKVAGFAFGWWLYTILKRRLIKCP